jgi:hypothetical protein
MWLIRYEIFYVPMPPEQKKIRKFQEGNGKKNKVLNESLEREKIYFSNIPTYNGRKNDFFHLNHETNTFSIAHIERKNR